MASIINASTSGVGGVITTADNSGDLNIQSGGSTKIAVTSAGANIVGTLTVNGVAPASGKVLQVVSAYYSGSTSNASATYADTGLTATITPTSSTSKILVLVNQAGVGKSNVNAGSGVNIKLLRNSTDLITFAIYASWTNSALWNVVGTQSTSYLDSPATTSAITYKTQFSNPAAANFAYVQNQGDTSTITLMEIAQ